MGAGGNAGAAAAGGRAAAAGVEVGAGVALDGEDVVGAMNGLGAVDAAVVEPQAARSVATSAASRVRVTWIATA